MCKNVYVLFSLKKNTTDTEQRIQFDPVERFILEPNQSIRYIDCVIGFRFQ